MIKKKLIDGVEVSSIILGSDYFGDIVSKSEAFSLYDLYLAYGGNHIDTAHLYTNGESERILGAWLKSHSRDDVYIATKGGHPPTDNMKACRLTRKEIKKDLEESLTNLGIDYVDMYWLHRDNPNADIAEVAETLNELIKEGKIRSIGCSNWKAKRIQEFNDYAIAHNLKGFCASQIKWSLAKTSPTYSDDPTLVEMNDTEYTFYNQTKLPVVAFASQGKGFFSKIAEGGIDALSEKAKARYLCDENLNRYKKASVLAEKYNTSISAIILSWLTSMSDVTVMPIVGCKNEAQLKDSLRASEITLSQEEIKYLTD